MEVKVWVRWRGDGCVRCVRGGVGGKGVIEVEGERGMPGLHG